MLGSIFEIEATARPGHTAGGTRGRHQRGARERCGRRARRQREVDRARNVFETQIFSGLQLVGGFGGVADQLNLYNHYVGTPDYLAQDIGRRRKVTPDSVRQFAQRYLAPNARVGRPWRSWKTGSRSRSPEAARSRRPREPLRPFRSTPTSRGVRSSPPEPPRVQSACRCRSHSSCRTV